MTAEGVTSLGVVGDGRVGSAIARLALAAGLEVRVAGSGDVTRTSARIALSAPGAVASSLDDAAAADIVVLALPLGRLGDLDVRPFAGRVAVDAMNYWWETDGVLPEFDDPATSTSETVQHRLPGARVVKALNHMSLYELENLAFPPGHPERRGAALAGDDPRDVQTVAGLLDALGFDPVPAGRLAEGVRFEPGTEVFGADDDAEEIGTMLERFWSSQRGRVVARARGLL